jgi:divalent anion:Na+ symporter, DASS family
MSSVLANKKIRSWLIIVAMGVAIWFIPPPEGVTLQAWRIFDIFVTTIVGFMLQPMPIGAISIISLGVTALLGLAKGQMSWRVSGTAPCGWSSWLFFSRGVLSRRDSAAGSP